MQAANIVGAVADAGVAGINGIKALWGLRALRGLELASSGSKVLYTGVRRLIDPITVRQQEAEAIYGWIRGLDAETNIATVARNTGMPEQVIRSVRQHVFFEEHTLLDGSVGRFTAMKASPHGGKQLQKVAFRRTNSNASSSFSPTSMWRGV